MITQAYILPGTGAAIKITGRAGIDERQGGDGIRVITERTSLRPGATTYSAIP